MLSPSITSSAANTPRRRHHPHGAPSGATTAADPASFSYENNSHHRGFVESTATSIIRRYGYLKHGYEHLPEQYLCPCCGGGAAAADSSDAAASADVLRDRARGPGLKFGSGGQGKSAASASRSCSNKTCMNYTQLGLSRIAAANKAAPKYDVSLLPPMTVDALRSRQAKEERIHSNAPCTLTVIVHKLSKDVPLGGGAGGGDGHVSILVRRGNFEGMTTLKRSGNPSSRGGTPRHGSTKKRLNKLTWNEKFDLPFDVASDDGLELFVLVGGVQSEREGGTLGLARVDDEALHSGSRGYREKVPIIISPAARRGVGVPTPSASSSSSGFVEVSWCLHSPPHSGGSPGAPSTHVDVGTALSRKRDAQHQQQQGCDARRHSDSSMGEDNDDTALSGGEEDHLPFLNAKGQPLRRLHSVHLDILRCVVTDITTATPACLTSSPRSASSPVTDGGGTTTTTRPLSPNGSATTSLFTSPESTGGAPNHNNDRSNSYRAPSSQRQFSSSSGCVLGGDANHIQDSAAAPSSSRTPMGGGGGAIYFTLEGVDGECSDAAALFLKKQVSSLRSNTTETLFLPTVAVDGDSTGLIGLEVLTADEFVDFDEINGGYTATTRPVRTIDHVASSLRAVCGVTNFGNAGRTWSRNNTTASDRQAQLLCCRRRADGDNDASDRANNRSPYSTGATSTSTSSPQRDAYADEEDAPLVLDVVGAVDTSHLWESILAAVNEYQLLMPSNDDPSARAGAKPVGAEGSTPIRVTVTLPLISVADEITGERGGRIIGEVKLRAWTTTEVYQEPHSFVAEDSVEDNTRSGYEDTASDVDGEEGGDQYTHPYHDIRDEGGLVNHDDAITALGEENDSIQNNNSNGVDHAFSANTNQDHPLMLALTVMRGVGLVDGRTRQPLSNPSVSVAVGALEAATTPMEVDPQQPSDICWNQVMYFKNVHDPETGEMNADMVEVFVHAVDPVTGISSCVAFGETPLGDDITAARVVNVYSTAPEDENGYGGGDVGPCGQVLVKFAWVQDEMPASLDGLASVGDEEENNLDNNSAPPITDLKDEEGQIYHADGDDGHGDSTDAVQVEGIADGTLPSTTSNAVHGNDDDHFVLDSESEDDRSPPHLHEQPPSATTTATTLFLRPPQNDGDSNAMNPKRDDQPTDTEVSDFTHDAVNDDADIDKNVDSSQTQAPMPSPATSSSVTYKPRPSIVLRFAPPPPPVAEEHDGVDDLDTPNYLTPIGTPRRHNNSSSAHHRRYVRSGGSRGNSPSPLPSPRPPKSPWYPAGKGAVDESHLPLAMRPSVIRQQEEILRLQKLLLIQQQRQDDEAEEEENDEHTSSGGI